MEKQLYFDKLNNCFVHINTEDMNKIETRCHILEADAADLFIIDDQTIFLKSTDLVLSRCRIDGVINASQRMLEAKNGKRSRRAPITVEYNTEIEKYIAIDGNSTLFVCKLWNVTDIPCKLETK